MKRSITIVGVSVAVSALGLVLASSGAPRVDAAAEGEADSNCYKLVVPLASVMEIVDDVFAKMPEAAEAASRRGFRALKREAEFIAEMGNLTSRLDGKCEEKAWVELSNRMKTTALVLSEAAGKYDKAEFLKQYDEVKATCGACHDKFRD
jgi:cytochrome c556